MGMSLSQKAGYYYGDLGKNCAEGLLLAANDEYGTAFTEAEIASFIGFGGGMGCGSTCGALTGAIAILSKLYGTREDIRPLCAGYVEIFRRDMGCNSIECSALEEKYRTPELRCRATVEKMAELLEKYIDSIEGKDRSREVSADGCTVSAADIKRVKGMGFLNQKGTNKFNGRIITRNGKITAAEAAKMAEAAERFGDGHMMLTTRMTMEISGIEYDDIEAFRAFIAEEGMQTGGTGSKVRPVVSCKGTTCQYGTYDTYALSEKAHRLFYEGYHNVDLPHKFKIAFGGCPNNCVKPNLNDIGISGVKIPQYDEEKCRGCKKCQIENTCPIGAAKLVDGKLKIDREKCNNCGRCVAKCPFHCADEGAYGWRIYIGGRWGKQVAHGKMLNHIFSTEQELLDAIEKSILLFRSEGKSGERFADTIARIGFEKAEKMILGSELLERKAEILGLNVVGGASC